MPPLRYLWPLGLAAILAAAYTWLWFDGAGRIKSELAEWTQKQRDRGVVVSYDEPEVHGFPYRMQVRLDNPSIRDPRAGLTWSGDALTGYTMPFNIRHIILQTEGLHRVTVTDGRTARTFSGTANTAQASLVWTDGDLDRVAIDLRGVSGNRLTGTPDPDGHVRSGEPARFTATRLQAFTRTGPQTPPTEGEDADTVPTERPAGGVRALAFRGEDIVWTQDGAEDHGIDGLAPAIASVDGQLTLWGIPDDDVDRFGWLDERTVRSWAGGDGRLVLDRLTLDWAPLNLSAGGHMRAGQDGMPLGRIDLLVAGHQPLINGLEQAGVLSNTEADLVLGVLSVVAAMGRDPEGRLAVPVKLRRGHVYVGPAKLNALPRLFDPSADDI